MGRNKDLFKKFLNDNRGVEGMPLKFAIIVLIAAIMMGAVIYMTTMMKGTVTTATDLTMLRANCEIYKNTGAQCDNSQVLTIAGKTGTTKQLCKDTFNIDC